MGDDTINNDNGLGGQDTGTIEGSGQNPVNTPPDNPPFPDPDPTPDPAPAPAEASDGGEDEFLKYVKMANDLHWIPGILKAYGADNQLPFGKVEEEAYEENEETEKLVFPNEYWDKEADADEVLDEDTWSPETKDPQVDEILDEEIFNDQPGPEFDADEDLEEEVFGDLYGEAIENADEVIENEEFFGVEAYAAESAAAESPLNQGEPEALDEYTFNEPESEEDTFTACTLVRWMATRNRRVCNVPRLRRSTVCCRRDRLTPMRWCSTTTTLRQGRFPPLSDMVCGCRRTSGWQPRRTVVLGPSISES